MLALPALPTPSRPPADSHAAALAETATLLAAGLFGADAVVLRLHSPTEITHVHDVTPAGAGVRLRQRADIHGPDGASWGSLEIFDADNALADDATESATTDVAEDTAISARPASPLAATQAAQIALDQLAAHIASGVRALQANHYEDHLTGLGNRHRFVLDAAAAMSERAPGVQVRLWAGIIDVLPLEDISRLVISAGLHRVELAISLMAERLVRTLPSGIRLYRLGLVRFGLFRDDTLEQMHGCLSKCVAEFEAPLRVDDVMQLDLCAVAGMIPVERGELDDLIAALYSTSIAARSQGRPVTVYNRQVLRTQQRHGMIVNSVRAAIASPRQLRLVYQPRERTADGNWTSVEALLRWNHPTLGDIPPGEFIPLVEHTALMPLLTDWVLGTGLRQLGEWQRALPALKMSINISASDLKRPGFDASVRRLMDENRVSARSLELEVTEGAIVRTERAVLETLGGLSRHGVEIAIDDFGAGYSNLTQLSELQVDVIKIDNRLVRAVAANPRAATIVQSVVDLAKRLGHRVVVEGVETAELKALSAHWGCDEMQGYYIARPMELSAMTQALATRHVYATLH
ncbi:bifunctional diguanylate cyclase/phosphodiesterase [Bordetella sp. LUAb4]|uniref:bifunctional diguanylate cyclase/phosphodiesterase n=1 Tax=Bordetella sp. LUAb4 TaxID=2843195 RepID=UPI001E3CAE9B|nr:bifunctional diguanylate cyclase/phosphodiesterase [Bordetella sp. LUAb4]